MSPVLMILIALSLAYLLSELLKKFGLPRVIGQICAGLILGITAIKHNIFTPQNMPVLDFLANLGVILLFYYVGLELNLRAMEKNVKQSLIISLFKALLPLALGYTIARYAFGFDIIPSIVIGVSLSAGAQSASVDLLEELKMLKTKIGTTIISVGVITDTIELLIVGTLFAIFEVAIKEITPVMFIIHIIIFLAFILLARAWFIPMTLKLFDREKSSTSRFMGAMIIVLLVVSLSEFLGIGALIGALAAGITIRQTIFKDVTIPNWEEHDIARSIHIIAFGFLIPLFFVWVGINTDLTTLAQNYILTTAFLIITIAGVLGGTMLATKINKGTLEEGITLGWGLSPKGDIGFVLGALALEAGIINLQVFSALIIMAVIITIISPIIFRRRILQHKITHT